MKVKVKMTCIFKSGSKLEDTIKMPKKNIGTVNKMMKEIEKYMSSSNPGGAQITWGRTIVQLSEVAAINFKESLRW